MKILITNHFISNFTGSELAVFDFAINLKNRGYEVIVSSLKTSEPLLSKFTEQNIKVINLSNDKLPYQEFDLLIGQHLDSVLPFILNQGVCFKKAVAFSLSPYVNMEKVPSYFKLLNDVYANSDETRTIRSHESKLKDIKIFYNSISGDFFNNTQINNSKKLKKLLIVGNKNFSNSEQFKQRCTDEGIDVSFFGVSQDNYKMITATDLLKFDAVLTIGRTVQYCFGLKIPVYCYGRFSGPGWITPQNFKKNMKLNFSGRSKIASNDNVDAEVINQIDYNKVINDLISGYTKNLTNLEFLNNKALQYFNLDNNINNMLLNLENSKDIDFKELVKHIGSEKNTLRTTILKMVIGLIPITKQRRRIRRKYL